MVQGLHTHERTIGRRHLLRDAGGPSRVVRRQSRERHGAVDRVSQGRFRASERHLAPGGGAAVDPAHAILIGSPGPAERSLCPANLPDRRSRRRPLVGRAGRRSDADRPGAVPPDPQGGAPRPRCGRQPPSPPSTSRSSHGSSHAIDRAALEANHPRAIDRQGAIDRWLRLAAPVQPFSAPAVVTYEPRWYVGIPTGRRRSNQRHSPPRLAGGKESPAIRAAHCGGW